MNACITIFCYIIILLYCYIAFSCFYFYVTYKHCDVMFAKILSRFYKIDFLIFRLEL